MPRGSEENNTSNVSSMSRTSSLNKACHGADEALNLASVKIAGFRGLVPHRGMSSVPL